MQPATVDDGVTEHVNRSCQGDTRAKSWVREWWSIKHSMFLKFKVFKCGSHVPWFLNKATTFT